MFKNVFKLLAVGLVVLGCLSARAQLMRPFVSSGLTISQIDGDEVYGFKQTGYSGGIGILLPFNADHPDQGMALSTEILFSQRGAKNTNLYDPFKYNCKLNYIDIPVMIRYLDKRAGATLGVGLQYSRLIKTNEKWTLLDTMILGMDRPLDANNHNYRKNDLSIVADFGFNIWRGFKFDFKWQYSLIPIRKDFTFYNSYLPEDDAYRTWQRDFKTHCVTLRILYVINEPHDRKVVTKRRRTAY